ncbi:hypothetical protein ABGT15_11285 [Flavobacterium enshiense]|uniref:hypothetical protein n=1 Tax=Flavobacterium enshiense TaxID=1341165 RepID=UPI00345CCF90
MIKKIILGISILFSTTILAQEGTASPYSSYGLGEVKFGGTAENRAMGGLGVIVDSSRINLQNPATYSSLKYTTFAVGGSNNRVNFKTNSQEEKAQRSTLDYLAVGLPMGKLGIAFGVMPYSSVGYKIRKDASGAEPIMQTFTGEGGINKAFLGGSYIFSKKLSLGLDVKYNFGKVTTEAIAYYPEVVWGSRSKNESRFSGFSTTLGAFYQTKYKNKYDWQSSFTFSPESKLTSENSRNVAVVTYTLQGTEIIGDQIDVEVADTEQTIPMNLTFGTSFGNVKKWMVGTEFMLQAKNDNLNVENVESKTGGRFSLGGYYIPKYNSFSSYFDRITYRAGYKFEDYGMTINGKNIMSHGASVGFGFPVGTTISSINLGLEYGKRGTRSNDLIEENFFNISLGLSFSDRWFVRVKYD